MRYCTIIKPHTQTTNNCTLSQESELPVDDFSRGVVFYLNKPDGKIVGVLTWNLFGKMDLAKKVEQNAHWY